MEILKEYKFERTVWANIELSKLCPGGNMQKFNEVIENENTAEQFNAMIDIILILNKAYERKAKRLNPEHEEKLLTREILLDIDEETLADVALAALGQIKADGKVTVEAESKKEVAEETKSK